MILTTCPSSFLEYTKPSHLVLMSVRLTPEDCARDDGPHEQPDEKFNIKLAFSPLQSPQSPRGTLSHLHCTHRPNSSHSKYIYKSKLSISKKMAIFVAKDAVTVQGQAIDCQGNVQIHLA